MDTSFAAHDEPKMFDGVGDVDVAFGNPRLFHSFAQEAPSRTDERVSEAIFAIPGLLADEHHSRACLPLAEDGLRRVLVKVAAAAAGGRVPKAF